MVTDSAECATVTVSTTTTAATSTIAATAPMIAMICPTHNPRAIGPRALAPALQEGAHLSRKGQGAVTLTLIASMCPTSKLLLLLSQRLMCLSSEAQGGTLCVGGAGATPLRLCKARLDIPGTHPASGMHTFTVNSS
jgi:hypothetical protein